MAGKSASDLAAQLLGVQFGGGSAVESVMHAGGCQYGGMGVDSIKDFYAKHKTPVQVVGAIAAVAIIGAVGYGVYKKFIWTPPAEEQQQQQQ